MNEITLLINSLGGGGAERVCVTLANKLSQRGWLVTLVLLHTKNAVMLERLSEKVKCEVLGVEHARYSFVALAHYFSAANGAKVLVFNHQLACILVLLRCLKLIDVTIIARNISNLSKKKQLEASFWHKYFVSFFVKSLYCKVDAVICQSAFMLQDLKDNYAIAPDKMTVINNPVSPEIETAAKDGDTSASERYLLCVGRLESVKAFHHAINALSLIAKEYPDLKLKIVGKGILEHELKALCETSGLQGRVIFEGFQSEMAPYFVNAIATVLTSQYEGFPNVLVESITMGTPVVAYDIEGGVGEIVIDGLNGYLAKDRDERDLAHKIEMVLSGVLFTDDIKKSSGKYSSDTVVNQYERVFLSC
ncbi:glycosyltransferase [Bermanella sp. R86510]|uniref:glycosyltransferase n=1 Tax=unclassified Bermanella TaxID=2627862 RepID=UPI0037C77898